MSRLGDRLAGAVAVIGALAFGVSAYALPLPFFSDPLGPRAFPLMVAGIVLLCGLVMVLRPEPDPDWPAPRTWGALLVSALVLVAYAYALKPLGFLLPTAVAAGVLSWQISPRPRFAVLAGLGLAAGLFVVFKFVLGLNLVGWPRDVSMLFRPAEVQREAPAADEGGAPTLSGGDQ